MGIEFVIKLINVREVMMRDLIDICFEQGVCALISVKWVHISVFLIINRIIFLLRLCMLNDDIPILLDVFMIEIKLIEHGVMMLFLEILLLDCVVSEIV
jgi:hypothetical protein